MMLNQADVILLYHDMHGTTTVLSAIHHSHIIILIRDAVQVLVTLMALLRLRKIPQISSMFSLRITHLTAFSGILYTHNNY